MKINKYSYNEHLLPSYLKRRIYPHPPETYAPGTNHSRVRTPGDHRNLEFFIMKVIDKLFLIERK